MSLRLRFGLRSRPIVYVLITKKARANKLYCVSMARAFSSFAFHQITFGMQRHAAAIAIPIIVSCYKVTFLFDSGRWLFKNVQGIEGVCTMYFTLMLGLDQGCLFDVLMKNLY